MYSCLRIKSGACTVTSGFIYSPVQLYQDETPYGFSLYWFWVASRILRESFASSSGVLREFPKDSPNNPEGFPKESRSASDKAMTVMRLCMFF